MIYFCFECGLFTYTWIHNHILLSIEIFCKVIPMILYYYIADHNNRLACVYCLQNCLHINNNRPSARSHLNTSTFYAVYMFSTLHILIRRYTMNLIPNEACRARWSSFNSPHEKRRQTQVNYTHLYWIIRSLCIFIVFYCMFSLFIYSSLQYYYTNNSKYETRHTQATYIHVARMHYHCHV